METIIETTHSIEGNLKFDSLFFTFHGVEFCDKRWRSTVKTIRQLLAQQESNH